MSLSLLFSPPSTTVKLAPSRHSLSPPPPLDRRRRRLLVAHPDGGDLRAATARLELVSRDGSHPDLLAFSLLLKSCIRSRAFALGRRVHRALARSRLEPDSVILNSLISLYSKSSDWAEAERVFRDMGDKRDLVSWSSMISCYANNRMEFEAVDTFVRMLEDGFFPNDYCFAAAIRACSVPANASIGDTVFGFIMKSGYLDSDVCVGCALIDMFAKGSADLVSARKVFEKMPERNVVAWTLMMTRCTQLGCPEKAVDLFLDMLVSGPVPDRFALTAVLSACSELELLSLGVQLHSWAIRSGLASDVCVGCSLVDMYVKSVASGSLHDSRKVFDRMQDHNVMSWTAIITGYVHAEENEEAIKLFWEMTKGPVRPNHFTFASVLKACGSICDVDMGIQIYALAIKLGFACDTCVGNSLISMYARSGHMEDAQRAFDALFEKNLVSYNTLVDAYAKSLESDEAFELLHEIEERGMGTSAFTFASLLSGAACVGAIGKGEQIHARMVKSGLDSNQCISNALISMYSRCGNIEAAFRVFNETGEKNIITWTSMITGFAKHGFGTRALDTFHKMLDAGVRPNEITYVAVLSSCSHVGLISDGWKHFRSMYTEHGIVPRTEHYACMVDLLGRSGSLAEALKFINSMPFRADTLVWRTFLGACRVHGNVELAKEAAAMIFEQEPDDPAVYILLSNMYASAGLWEDAAAIRKKMKLKNLTKEAGCSWIEVKNTVHKFYVGDTSHPKAREIYDELDQLASRIKKLGYVPNTEFVLHDVEEEKKEQYLLQHSEKIAVVFGLISTSSPKSIRVFKNLRICGDCHSAFKYISMATGRSIVVRDANRFHHFMDGRCSCNDYW
ncbi:pentatricopeptide repeat-containing protein At3g49170, chloroplastic [Syzygium oleosum]|uniref:pentatricopeptide repeat-containing protein At3g49170, chloroplastic n=1 Tax=Syzygium oleosum TaxID=219896 RepID=UPI0011D21E97|nr:pentatricopeptide repeat-containing protein At3g49170, chloroplastic [Syzygium oleosum]